MTELARGIYRYWRDGELQAITEPWRLIRAGRGLRLQAERRVNDAPMLGVEADYDARGWHHLHLAWAASSRSFSYEHRGDCLEWHEEGGGAAHSLALPADALLFPLLRAAAGPLVRSLAAAPRSVVVPCIRDPSDSAHFLRPLLSQRSATLLAEEPDHTLHYRYCGGEYGDTGSDYWLDRHALLLRYRWESPQGVWVARLEDYWTDPCFSGFAERNSEKPRSRPRHLSL